MQGSTADVRMGTVHFAAALLSYLFFIHHVSLKNSSIAIAGSALSRGLDSRSLEIPSSQNCSMILGIITLVKVQARENLLFNVCIRPIPFLWSQVQPQLLHPSTSRKPSRSLQISFCSQFMRDPTSMDSVKPPVTLLG